MRRVHVQHFQLFGDFLPGPARIPVVRVDHIVAHAAQANGREQVGHKIADMVVHILLANKLSSAKRNAPDA
jgi:hypothetical protein